MIKFNGNIPYIYTTEVEPLVYPWKMVLGRRDFSFPKLEANGNFSGAIPVKLGESIQMLNLSF